MSNYFTDEQISLLAKAKTEKKYIHLKNENQSLRDIMDLNHLNKLISMHNCWNQKNFSLVLDKNIIPFANYSTSGDDLGFSNMSPDPLKVENYIKKGASLVLNDLIYLSKDIEKLAIDLQNVTNGKCQANLYFSMQSHQAFAPHFDTHDVFALHCEGEKVWNIYENFEQDPINHPIFKNTLDERTKKSGKIIEQILLKPGDLLYLPRGQFHDALASKNGTVHLAFGITYMKPLDIFQYYWEEFIVNEYFRSDIKEISSINNVKEIHDKISKEVNKILNNQQLYEHSLKFFNNWPYKLTGYDIQKIVNDGVQYEISKNISILVEGDNLFLSNEKTKVPVPEKFLEITRFTFENKVISHNLIKNNFSGLKDETIIEFIDAMKNMKVFV
tara:strand:+ start:706 stop:1863 length:1158 start_codon:yes stop_codon:yes gene_type:complete